MAFGRIYIPENEKKPRPCSYIFDVHLTTCVAMTSVLIAFSLEISREDLEWGGLFCALTAVLPISINTHS